MFENVTLGNQTDCVELHGIVFADCKVILFFILFYISYLWSVYVSLLAINTHIWLRPLSKMHKWTIDSSILTH